MENSVYILPKLTPDFYVSIKALAISLKLESLILQPTENQEIWILRGLDDNRIIFSHARAYQISLWGQFRTFEYCISLKDIIKYLMTEMNQIK